MTTALLILFRVACVLFMAWDIRDAIVTFKNQEYFRFGFNIVLALLTSFELFYTYF